MISVPSLWSMERLWWPDKGGPEDVNRFDGAHVDPGSRSCDPEVSPTVGPQLSMDCVPLVGLWDSIPPHETLPLESSSGKSAFEQSPIGSRSRVPAMGPTRNEQGDAKPVDPFHWLTNTPALALPRRKGENMVGAEEYETGRLHAKLRHAGPSSCSMTNESSGGILCVDETGVHLTAKDFGDEPDEDCEAEWNLEPEQNMDPAFDQSKDMNLVGLLDKKERESNDREGNSGAAISGSSSMELQCLQCQKTFTSTFNLNRHITAVHHAERSFECKMCGLKFKLKESLVSHTRSVHGQGAHHYKCSVCGKKFSRKGNALRHYVDKHSNIKPFNCVQCKKSFGSKYNLDRHLKSSHKEGCLEEAASSRSPTKEE